MTKDEFARLVLDSTDSLYRVSKGILRNDSDCEDAVWEAIGIGFARLDTLQHDRYAKTWLIRILIHECCRLLRERKYRANVGTEDLEYRTAYAQNGCGVYSREGNREEMTEVLSPYTDLYEALMKLEEKYRIPIELYYLEGYSVKEIAEILESTEGTVKSWLFRGRNYLRQMLKEE